MCGRQALTCKSCRRSFHVRCDPDGDNAACGLCYWCRRRRETPTRPERDDRFDVGKLPKRVQTVESAIKKALPLLPQATIPLPTFRYKDVKKTKLAGKGPGEEEVAFIMTLPWMKRDVNSQKFVDMMQCEFQIIQVGDHEAKE